MRYFLDSYQLSRFAKDSPTLMFSDCVYEPLRPNMGGVAVKDVIVNDLILLYNNPVKLLFHNDI